MSTSREKPQGASGKVRVHSEGVEWHVIPFPGQKAERERLIANLFVQGFAGYVAMQSEPSLAPFGAPKQNEENDLDFTVTTADGEKLMELAEFAPLKQHGPRFADAPKTLDPKEKAALAVALVQDKSAHQGGAGRFLVLYTTEHAFWLDPIAVERMRRLLTREAPKFDRVYYVSPHDLNSASVTEIYPGKPHHIIGAHTDEELDRGRSFIPHPSEMTVGSTTELTGTMGVNGKPVSVYVKINVSGLKPVKHMRAQT